MEESCSLQPAPERSIQSTVSDPVRDTGGLAELADGQITLQEALALANSRNPTLAGRRAALDRAAAQSAQARAVFYPHVAMELSYLKGDAPSQYLFSSIDAGTLGKDTNFNGPGTFDSFSSGVALQWNLWNGGRDSLAFQAASAEQEAAAAQVGVSEESIALAVVEVFLNYKVADQLLQSDQASVRAVSSQVEEIRTRVEGGSALRSDLLSLQVRLAEAKEREIRTDIARRMTVAALRSLLSLPAGSSFNIVADFGEVPDVSHIQSQALAQAKTNRPELAAARQTYQAAQLNMERGLRAWYPAIDLSSRYYAQDRPASIDYERDNWLLSVGLSQPLFDGGRRSAQLAQARAGLREAQDHVRAVEDVVSSEIETTLLSLKGVEARVQVARGAEKASEESYALVEEQYRGGSATVTRYLEAEAARSQARVSRITAEIELQRAEFQLARSVGLMRLVAQ